MTRISPENGALALEMIGIHRLPPQTVALNRDVPEHVTSAIEAGRDVMLLSSVGGVAAEVRQTLVRRLQAAGMLTITRTAPMGELGPLHDAIRDLMIPDQATAWTIVLLIDHSEALNAPTLLRLQALAAIRRAGRPVLRVILLATPELLPLLESVGLSAIWEDPTAHIRLLHGFPAFRPQDAQAARLARPLNWWSRSLARAPSFGRLLTAGGLGLALCVSCLMAWKILFHTPYQVSAQPGFVDVPSATAVQSFRPVTVSPRITVATLLVPPQMLPAPLQITDNPLHITIRYDRRTAGAETRARKILLQLHEQNLLADGPVPVALPGRSSLAYGFAQDRDAAIDLGHALNLPAPHLNSRTRGSPSSRPGELSISIGAHDRSANPTTAAARRST